MKVLASGESNHVLSMLDPHALALIVGDESVECFGCVVEDGR